MELLPVTARRVERGVEEALFLHRRNCAVRRHGAALRSGRVKEQPLHGRMATGRLMRPATTGDRSGRREP